MLDMHSKFLTDATTAEMKVVIDKAYAILSVMGNSGLDDSLEEIIMLDSISDTGETVTRITNMLRDMQDTLLVQHEVYVVDGTPLDVTTSLLEGLLALPEYEDMATVYRIATLDQDPVEGFCQAMQLVTPYAADNLVMSLESVGGSLLRRMREIAGTREEEMLSEEERIERASHISKINQFCRYTRSRHYRMIDMLQDGWSVGYPFTVYADDVGREFEGVVPEQIAKEMILMAFASSDGAVNPRAVIKPNMERYIASMNVMTRVDIEVNKLLQGFEHE